MYNARYNVHNSSKCIFMRLGDKLEWLFRVTGIQWIVKKIYPNCNCDKRRDKMNEFEFKINRK